ncbi:MAG: protein phosphatase CheZ, partial [Burkholderiales bacterium]|nr:protein phosphatase CheZ [Burkholderiales bacterium]
MTDSADDLDALFEEMANQRLETNVESPSSPPVSSEPAPQEPAPVKFNFHSDDADATKPIFDRLGGIVRMLHDSMRELGYDRSLSDVAVQIADAQGRLEYVATLTEQAANKVLNATDLGMPEQDELAKKAKSMDARWTDLFEGKLSVDEFKTLATDSKTFANNVLTATDAEKARLLDIMMAQDFQDLTGQLIKKVVAINKRVEHELTQI